MMTGKTKTQLNQSSEKLFTILELLAQTGEPMRLLDISEKLKINASTTLRFIKTMEKCGYVSQNRETLKYTLTYKICALANKMISRSSIRVVASPFLKDLSHTFGESVCLSVEQDMKVVYIDVVDGPDQMIRSMQRIGNVAPLHCTAVGKIFLSRYSDQKLMHVVETMGLSRLTQNTIVSLEELKPELEKVGRLGYAMDNEECEIGARCIACPIHDHTGSVVAGISVTGPAVRLTDSFISERVECLIQVSRDVSRLLGYEGR